MRPQYSHAVPRVAPYGTWTSPVSARAVAAAGLRLAAVTVDGDEVYWLEGRPEESGRNALVRCSSNGTIVEVTPPDANVRSRAHEYGGGAFAVSRGTVYYANFADQRVYRLDTAGASETTSLSTPQPLTPLGAWRYADFFVDWRRQRLICVREDHTQPNREPISTLVSVPLAGPSSAGDILAEGYDFYSAPRLSPDGSRLAWLSWRHPQMPWDGTELWVADVTASGALANAVRVAGGPAESIYQPGWSPDGVLLFVSDRDGWWRLYRRDGSIEAVLSAPPADAEFGRPEWIFGTSTWACAGPARLVASYTRAGRWHLATIDPAAGTLADVEPAGRLEAVHDAPEANRAHRATYRDLQPHEWLAATPTHAFVVAGSSTGPDAIVRIDLNGGTIDTLRSASAVPLDAGDVSIAEPVEFQTDSGVTAHAFYYAPRNQDFEAPPSEAPPLLVVSHGGPTAATSATLDLKVQYWTTRGFAVVDVNYRGSSGYGRAYREQLRGQWGIVDVADVINAARFVSGRASDAVSGEGPLSPSGPPSSPADAQRLIIRGGSAGGYTTLAALTFRPDVFKAGASYYGISDLEALEVDTHKFESHYSHSLIGPYPQARDVYRARSPVHFIHRLACPLILFQGLEDKVVPPNQSQMMADAVRANGLPVAYLAFEGEQHGFRKAATIVRCHEAELYFYGAVFGFTPADHVEPVVIDNL